jgi:EmrB/QacA subfamily drug resistance transporter
MTPDPHNPHHARRWWILAILGIAQLMVVLDATVVNIALPSAQESLGFSDENRQWIITAYALAFGSLLLIGGRIGDLFGRRQVFIGGLLGFAVASAIGGAAQSFAVLVAARGLQGVFGALLAPAALSLLTTTFTSPNERGKAFGIFGAVAGAGGAVGLLLGGVLTEYLSWRWAMYVNLFFAIPAALGALALIRSVAHPDRPRLDIPGTLTASAGLFAIVYGFSQAETRGWGDGVTIAFLAAGVALLVAFVWVQTRVAAPLVPLRVILDRNRGTSYLAMGIAGAGMFGVFLFLTYYLQRTLGMTPVETGLAFLPLAGAVMISATTATATLVPRFGPRPLVTLGMGLAAVGMVLLAQLGVDSAYASHVLPALILMGAGMGLIFAPGMAIGTLGVAAHEAGIASALLNVGQQVGGSLGTALLSTLSASAVTSFMAGKAATPAVAEAAAVHGFTTAFWWAAGIFAVGAIVAAALFRSGAPELEPSAEPVLAH